MIPHYPNGQLTALQVRILKRICPTGDTGKCTGAAYVGKSKITVLLGSDFFDAIKGKSVIDFGCGEGDDAVEMALRGAKEVVGIDIREDVLHRARDKATRAGVSCRFTTHTTDRADAIVSLDAFEHFSDPAAILSTMADLLVPGGCVYVSFGPTWYHPLGGHLFSVFPWAHLLFSERALIQWRSGFKTDGATRFSEVAGGLNQMTIRRFERLVAASPLKLVDMECVPIRKLAWAHNYFTREFTSAIVRCRLTTATPA